MTENTEPQIMDWDILVAKVSKKVFFIVPGKAAAKDAVFDPKQGALFFKLEGKERVLADIPEEVSEKMRTMPVFLNIKDESEKSLYETPVTVMA